MGFQMTFFIFYSGLTLNQDKATKPQTVQIVRQGEVTPYWFKVNPLYKVKMDEAAYLVIPYFVLPKIGYC